MKTGLIGAMQEEILLLKDELTELNEIRIGCRHYYLGNIGNHEIVMCLSGWGKVAAASAATTLINEFQVNQLVFIGLAGSLHSGLNIGDIVVADSLVQHDVDLTRLDNFPQVHPPFWKSFRFKIGPDQLNFALQAVNQFVGDLNRGYYPEISPLYHPEVVVGTIGTGDQFVASEWGKKLIREKYPDVLCTEMEGAAVAQVAADYELPCSVIRIISDKADSDAHQAFADFLDQNISKISVAIAKLLFR